MIHPKFKQVLVKPEHTSDVPVEGRIIQVTKKVPSSGYVVDVSGDMDEYDRAQVPVGSRVKFFNNHRIEEGDYFLLDIESIILTYPEGVSVKFKTD